jgi:hypothetical protein
MATKSPDPPFAEDPHREKASPQACRGRMSRPAGSTHVLSYGLFTRPATRARHMVHDLQYPAPEDARYE